MSKLKIESLIGFNKLPHSPGIYFFYDKNHRLLYVGRATSLKSRVNSYFRDDLYHSRGPGIIKMIGEAVSVKFKKTDSVLEAVILEADIIKKFKPRYNVKEKDDKSFNCVAITDEKFPRIHLARQKDLAAGKLKSEKVRTKIKSVFGPFPNGAALRQVMKIVRKIFPYRDGRCAPGQGKPCFNRQIGLCPGVCTQEVSEKEYKKTVTRVTLFFKGKKKQLTSKLLKDMEALAKVQKFEKAGEIKRIIDSINHIQDVALLKREPRVFHGKTRIEGFDAAHLAGSNAVGVMTVVEGGETVLSEYRKFKLRETQKGDDISALGEVLVRRFRHPEWTFPDLIVVDGGKGQLNKAMSILHSLGLAIPVVSVLKDHKHKPKQLLGATSKLLAEKASVLLANAEAHRFAIKYHRLLARSGLKG
ncbi:MAG: GIY-YIG nuclease family protein [bacterium]|nr:GIY-YIG nuclease family protein [bacterium]